MLSPILPALPGEPTQSQSQNAAQSLAQRRGAKSAAGQAQTARSIDPAWTTRDSEKVAARPPRAGAPQSDSATPTGPRANLMWRDPNAPVGPPPSFEANVLDRMAEEALKWAHQQSEQADDTRSQGASGGGIGALLMHDRAPAPGPYDAPPSKTDKAARDVTELRGLSTPTDQRKMDIAR